MKIALDCRYIGRSGIGRVCKGIADNLDYDKNEYYLIGKREQLKNYPAARIIEDDTDPYSVKGLLSFDKRINKECDALFIPNFIVPFGVRLPVYTVMHDLMFLDVKETTKGLIDKTVKKILLKRCVKKSRAVFCVSAFTRDRCRQVYKRYSDRFTVNYPGIAEEASNTPPVITDVFIKDLLLILSFVLILLLFVAKIVVCNMTMRNKFTEDCDCFTDKMTVCTLYRP